MRIFSKNFKRISMIAFAFVLTLTGVCITQSNKAYAYTTLSYTGKVYITTANVNVRKGPGESYASYGILPQNTAMVSGRIIGTSGGWTQVSIYNANGSEVVGYISSSYLTQTTSNREYNATTNTNVRKGPGTSYSTICTMPTGSGQTLFYNYTVSADGYTWVADENAVFDAPIGSSGYYVCAASWTVLSYYQ